MTGLFHALLFILGVIVKSILAAMLVGAIIFCASIGLTFTLWLTGVRPIKVERSKLGPSQWRG